MSSDVAIKVENVSKCYQIYDTPRARLKQLLLPRLRHVESLKERMHRTAEQRVDYAMKTFTADGL